MRKKSRKRSNPEVVQNKGLVTREEPENNPGARPRGRGEPEDPEGDVVRHGNAANALFLKLYGGTLHLIDRKALNIWISTS
jgi:hypothetical protein